MSATWNLVSGNLDWRKAGFARHSRGDSSWGKLNPNNALIYSVFSLEILFSEMKGVIMAGSTEDVMLKKRWKIRLYLHLHAINSAPLPLTHPAVKNCSLLFVYNLLAPKALPKLQHGMAPQGSCAKPDLQTSVLVLPWGSSVLSAVFDPLFLSGLFHRAVWRDVAQRLFLKWISFKESDFI